MAKVSLSYVRYHYLTSPECSSYTPLQLGTGQVLLHVFMPASSAQLDARPTGDQEVAGSTPARSATCFCGDLIMKYQ